LSYAAVKIGMAAIIGAFFAGLAFAEYSPRWNLRERASAITDFLTPFFFFSMGVRLDFKVYVCRLIISAIVFTLLAFLSKLIDYCLPVMGTGWKPVLRVAWGRTPRGKGGLIVALVGLKMIVIPQPASALFFFMPAAPPLVAPPLLRIMF